METQFPCLLYMTFFVSTLENNHKAVKRSRDCARKGNLGQFRGNGNICLSFDDDSGGQALSDQI